MNQRFSVPLGPLLVGYLFAACPPGTDVMDAGRPAGGSPNTMADAGSGGGPSGGGSAGGSGVADAGRTDGGLPSGFWRAQTEAVIARRIRCGFYASSYVSGPTSLSNLEQYEAVDRAAADDRVVFDAARAAQCLAALESQPCIERDPPLACRDVIVGRVPEGGDCYLSTECATGGRCLGNTCPRKCLGLSQEGEFATSARPCGPGLRSDASGVCAPVVVRREGEDCLVADGGIPVCDRNLFCRRSSVSMAVCSRPVPAGGSCTGSDICEEGTLCVSGACLRYARLNEPCVPLGGSGDRRCQIGLRCAAATVTSTGSCQLPGPMGSTCGSSGDCQPGLICLGANFNPGVERLGTCDTPTMPGLACSSDSECGPGHACEPLQLAVQCYRLRLLNEPCGPERCSSPYVCRLGRCAHDCHDLTP